MKYISQLNGFWNWRRLNGITHSQVDLYFAILNCGNACGWRSEFTVPNSTIIGMCQISASELAKNRNALIQKGLIRYSKGKKGNAGLYSIAPLYDSNQDINHDSYQDINVDINQDINHENITRVKKKNKTKNKPPVSPPLDVFAQVEDDALRKALYDFAAMRNAIKRPLTERAKELLLGKLRKLSQDVGEQVKILDQSIMHDWKGVFELEGDGDRGQSAEGHRDDTQAGGERRSFGVQL